MVDDAVHLAKFRRMIKDSGNVLISSLEFEDDLLFRFIRRPNVNLNESLQLLTAIVEARFKKPYASVITSKGCPSSLRDIYESGIFGVLRQRDQLGRKVVWFRLYRWDPSQIPERELVLATLMLGWELLASKTTQLKGVVVLFDMSGTGTAINMEHFKLMRKFIKLISKYNPFHNGGIHIMFAPIVVSLGFSVVKTLLLPRHSRRLLHFHIKKSKLHEYIPASILPNFFGGMLTERKATDDNFMENLMRNDRHYYKALMEIGTAIEDNCRHNCFISVEEGEGNDYQPRTKKRVSKTLIKKADPF